MDCLVGVAEFLERIHAGASHGVFGVPAMTAPRTVAEITAEWRAHLNRGVVQSKYSLSSTERIAIVAALESVERLRERLRLAEVVISELEGTPYYVHPDVMLALATWRALAETGASDATG